MPRARRATFRSTHQTLGAAAETWMSPTGPQTLRRYGFQHGIAHLLACDKAAHAEPLLTDFAYGMARLASEDGPGARPLARDAEAVLATDQLADADTLRSWEDFLRTQSHVLARGDAQWRAERILLQLAVEHADDSPVTAAAEAWLQAGHCDWLWLRRTRRVPRAHPDACLRVLEGHSGPVTGAMCLSADRLLSWSHDQTLRIWDRHTASPISILDCGDRWNRDDWVTIGDGSKAGSSWFDSPEFQKSMANVIEGGTVLEDGRLVSWASDSILRYWDTETGTSLETFEGAASGVLLISDGRLISGSTSNTLHIWDLANARELTTLEGHTGRVTGALVLDGDRLLSWSRDSTLRVWDLQTGANTITLAGHTNPVGGALMLGDGRLVSWPAGPLSASPTLRIWDGHTGEQVASIDGHTTAVAGAVCLTDGRLVSWSVGGAIHIWDPGTAQQIAVLEGHTGLVNGVVPLDRDRLLSWSTDGTLRIWSAPSGAQVAVLEGHTNPVAQVQILSDGRLLSWSKGIRATDLDLRTWDPSTGQCVGRLRGHTGTVQGVLQFDGDSVLSWSADGTLRIWDIHHSHPAAVYEGHTDTVWGTLVLDHSRIVSWSGGYGCRDHDLRTWNPETGALLDTLSHEEARREQPDLWATWTSQQAIHSKHTGEERTSASSLTLLVGEEHASVRADGHLVLTDDDLLAAPESPAPVPWEDVNWDEVVLQPLHTDQGHGHRWTDKQVQDLRKVLEGPDLWSLCMQSPELLPRIAAWHGQGNWTARQILPSGTLVATCNESLVFLQLRHGSRRVTIDEATAILGLESMPSDTDG